jgi:large subunit ribosomal protein L35
MPKMKTHRGAAKRFKVTATGKVKFKRAHLRHCLEHKKKSTKNELQKGGIMVEADARKVRAMLRLQP